MASTSEELFAAIEAGGVSRVLALLEDDPGLASARDAEGVSVLMRARYRFDRGLISAVQSRVVEMDLFEAVAAGDLDRLTELLASDPRSVDLRSGDGLRPCTSRRSSAVSRPRGCSCSAAPTSKRAALAG